MIRLCLLCLSLVVTTSSFAQQQTPPDPITLQRAIGAIQQQRERFANEAASYQIEAQRLAEEVSKLKAEIEQMKKAKE